jgi:hypothetical protein
MLGPVELEAADGCGEVTSHIADLAPDDAWFIEGREHPVMLRDLRQLYMQGTISLGTLAWSCAQPGWRKLDDVWEVHRDIANHSVPNDCCAHTSLEFMPTMGGWIARRGARLRALRLRLFARVVYWGLYRKGLEQHRDVLSSPDASPNRRAIFERWWRRAGLPMSVLTEGITPEAAAAVEAAERATRYPGWLRARLAGVPTYDPAPWIKVWSFVMGKKLPERGPGGMMLLVATAPEMLLKDEKRRRKTWFPPGIGPSRPMKLAVPR